MLITKQAAWKRAESPSLDAIVDFWGGPEELRRMLLLREEVLGPDAEISRGVIYRIFPGGSFRGRNTPIRVASDVDPQYAGAIELLSYRAIDKAIALYRAGHTLDLEMRALLEQVDAQNLKRVS
jgi:hypothetical protein